MKKIVKLSVVREEEERGCPYGLPISEACENVGKLIDNMCAIEEAEEDAEKELASKSNNRIYMMSNQNDENKEKCKYANVIFDNDKVECNYGDYAAGIGSAALNPGPMVNTYMDFGFYSVPYNSDYTNFNHYFFAKDEGKTKKDGSDD